MRGDEEFRFSVTDGHGHVSGSALKAFRNLMRQGPRTYPVNPRLAALVGIVSDHFGGRTLYVFSGYRAFNPGQYNPHSNHGLGRAIDFRVEGINIEDLWAFCRTLEHTGCGYYPNSGFVHLDAREKGFSWIDRSLPGDPPKYDAPQALATVGTAAQQPALRKP